MTTILRPGDPWTIIAPTGWEPVAEVCRQVYENLERTVDRMVDAFLEEIHEFGEPDSAFTRTDLVWSSSRNVAGFLAGLAEQRSPVEAELNFRRIVGQRSAARGFPYRPLVDSYHIAYRELWSVLVEEAENAGGDAPKLLLNAGASVWERMHSTVSALTEGYERELSRLETIETRTASDLLAALAKDPESSDSRTLAKELTFNPDGDFLAIALSSTMASIQTARTIVSTLHPSRAAAAPDGPFALVLMQVADIASAERAVKGIDAQIGFGCVARGLEGAHRSVGEARLALALSQASGRSSRFETDWLHVLAHAHRSSLEQMLKRGIDVAHTKPHLVEAVIAFANSDSSIAQGARDLNLSQNSFRYRLDRWQILTGWDPRQHDGMTRSLTALGLAGLLKP